MNNGQSKPRWRVWLWTTALDVATGFMAVVGAVVLLCIAAIWLLGVIDGPPVVAWPLRVGLALVALAWIGRRVDRWSDGRTRDAPQPQVPKTLQRDPNRHPVYPAPPRRTDETRP